MPHQDEPDDLARRAAEQLLGDASLRDELTDSEAQPLIDWGLAQATALARSAAALPDAEPVVDEAVKGLRRLMKRINRFIGLRAYHDPDALAGELDRLRVVSAKLYGERPALLPDDAARYALVDEIDGLGNDEVVERLLALFGPQPGAATLDDSLPASAPPIPEMEQPAGASEQPAAPHPTIDPHVPEHFEPPPRLHVPSAGLQAPPVEPQKPPGDSQEPSGELRVPPAESQQPPPADDPAAPESPLAGLLRFLRRETPSADDDSADQPPPDFPPQEG